MLPEEGKCKKCGGKGELGEEHTLHGAKIVCEDCGSFIGWTGKQLFDPKTNWEKAFIETYKWFLEHDDRDYFVKHIIKVMDTFADRNTKAVLEDTVDKAIWTLKQ